MIRLFGSRQDKKATNNAVKDLLSELEHTEQDNSVQLSNTEQLLLIEIEQLKRLIEQLEKQLEYVKANENWLKQQLEQKLIEQKSYERRGLLSKLFG
jgi:molecular chaperone GrpE (heat shock protein)